MAISFDAASTSGAASQNQASFSWSHAGGTPEGVVLFTFTLAELDILDGDNATSVTYGGVSMTAVSGGRAEVINTQSGNEIDCKLWFLGSGVPSGTQTVVVNRTNNSLKMWAGAMTVNSSQNSAVHAPGIILFDGEPATISETNVADGSGGTGNSMRFAGIICENGNYATFLDDPINFNTLYPGLNSTYRGAIDFGNSVAMIVNETVAGTGSRDVGFVGDSSYRAAVHVAVKDVSGGGTTVVKDIIGRSGIIPFKR